MTIIAGGSAVGAPPWMSRADLAQASGLREDLVARFIPAAETPNGPMYPAHHLALAVYVKELTDHNLPPAAVEDKIREFTSRPQATSPYVPAARSAVSRRGLWTAVGGAAAAALVLGGVLGGLIGSSQQHDASVPGSTATVAVETSVPKVNPTIPAVPDPVCAEWAPIADSYNARETDWGSIKGGDPNLPASSWTADQQAVSKAIIPVLTSQVADLRMLADKSRDPFLASLLRAQATYQEKFISVLPNYQPSDRALWQAASDYGVAVRSTCKTVAPK